MSGIYFISLIVGASGTLLMAGASLVLTGVLLISIRDFLDEQLSPIERAFRISFSAAYVFWIFMPAIDVGVENFASCRRYLGHCISQSELVYTLSMSSLYYMLGIIVLSLMVHVFFGGARNERLASNNTINPKVAVFASFTIVVYSVWTTTILGNPLELIFSVVNRYVRARSWNEYYNLGGDVTTSVYSLFEYLSVFSSSLLLYVWVRGGKLLSVYKVLCILGVSMVLLKTFNRSFAILIFAPTILHYLSNNHKMASNLLRSAAYVFVAVSVATALLSYRRASDYRHYVDARFSLLPFDRTNDFFWESALAIQLQSKIGSIFDNVFWEHVTFLIPRSLFEGKPFPESIRQFGIYREKIDVLTGQGNVFPGIVGYFHLNYGYLGALVHSAFVFSFISLIGLSVSRSKSYPIRFFLLTLSCALLFLNVRNIQTGINVVLLVFSLLVVILSKEFVQSR